MLRLLSVVALLGALAACGRDDENEADRSVAPPATTSVAAPAPGPASVELRLTPEGLGPLRIGMTREAVVEAWGEDSEPDALSGADPGTCDQFRPLNAPAGTLVMIENGRMTRISLIRDSTLRTDRGIRLGDTELDVRSTYGAGLEVEPHKYIAGGQAKYLTAWAVPGSRGVRYETDAQGVVRLIHAGDATIRYVEGCS